MRSLAYTRFELVRTFRNWRLLVFSLGFPLLLFFMIAAPNRHEHNFDGSGIALPAVLHGRTGLVRGDERADLKRRANRERADRRLDATASDHPAEHDGVLPRQDPDRVRDGALTIALLYASGVSIGVSLPAERWLEMTGLILVALIPFAALGILLGHLLTADSIGPAAGGLVSLLALVSGSWFPIGSHGVLHDIGEFLPSYWLTRASHVSLGGQPWNATGWIVIAAWTVVLAILARVAYRRDTARV